MVMKPVDEFEKKVSACVNELQKERKKIEKLLKSYKVISEKVFSDFNRKIDNIFRRELKKLFGNESKPGQYWFQEEFLNFNGKPSEELVFAFWGCDGSESYRRGEEEPTPFLRENIYLRGTRWETKEERDKFYENFRKIKYVFKNHVPVDFFGCYVKSCPPILKIVTTPSEPPSTSPYAEIFFPIGESFVTSLAGGTGKLKQYFSNLSLEKPEETEQEDIVGKLQNGWDLAKAEIENLKIIQKLAQEFEKAEIEFEVSERLEKLPENLGILRIIRYDPENKLLILNKQVSAMTEEEKRHFLELSTDDDYQKAINELFKKSQEQFLYAIIFKILASFQCYPWLEYDGNWPYDLYIITPKNENKKENKACFSLAVSKENQKILEYLPHLQRLIDEGFVGYRAMEVKLWEKLSLDVHYYWLWKREYEERKEKYEALCNAVKFIIQGICEKRKIKYRDIAHRVKEFDKFYDKIINKVNKMFSRKLDFDLAEKTKDYLFSLKDNADYDKEEKLLLWYRIMPKDGKENLLQQADEYREGDKEKYEKLINDIFMEMNKDEILTKDLIMSPKFNFERIIEKKYIKDIAGVRVNCYYKSDAKKLWEFIKSNKEYGLNLFDDPKEPTTKPGHFDYPRYHHWVRLAKPRLDLPEYSDLENLPCEIQIGTVLEEGWAEVDHKIIYKSESFLPDEEIKELKQKSFSKLLPCIRTTDKGFDDLRKEREEKDFKHGGSENLND